MEEREYEEYEEIDIDVCACRRCLSKKDRGTMCLSESFNFDAKTNKIFTNPGKYRYNPSNNKSKVKIMLCGAGGGGSGGTNKLKYNKEFLLNDNTEDISGGGSGGGSGYTQTYELYMVPGMKYFFNVIVGSGGAGGNPGEDGTNGKDTYVEIYLNNKLITTINAPAGGGAICLKKRLDQAYAAGGAGGGSLESANLDLPGTGIKHPQTESGFISGYAGLKGWSIKEDSTLQHPDKLEKYININCIPGVGGGIGGAIIKGNKVNPTWGSGSKFPGGKCGLESTSGGGGAGSSLYFGGDGGVNSDGSHGLYGSGGGGGSYNCKGGNGGSGYVHLEFY